MYRYIMPQDRAWRARPTLISHISEAIGNSVSSLEPWVFAKGQEDTKEEEVKPSKLAGSQRKTRQDFFPVVSRVQIAFLNSITMPALLMTPVITAAMSKLIKVVGSLSYTFMSRGLRSATALPSHRHGGTPSGPSAFNPQNIILYLYIYLMYIRAQTSKITRWLIKILTLHLVYSFLLRTTWNFKCHSKLYSFQITPRNCYANTHVRV